MDDTACRRLVTAFSVHDAMDELIKNIREPITPTFTLNTALDPQATEHFCQAAISAIIPHLLAKKPSTGRSWIDVVNSRAHVRSEEDIASVMDTLFLALRDDFSGQIYNHILEKSGYTITPETGLDAYVDAEENALPHNIEEQVHTVVESAFKRALTSINPDALAEHRPSSVSRH